MRQLSDVLIINSGKLNGLEHDKLIGVLDREEQRITTAEVQRAVLVIIVQKKLPESFRTFGKLMKNGRWNVKTTKNLASYCFYPWKLFSFKILKHSTTTSTYITNLIG